MFDNIISILRAQQAAAAAEAAVVAADEAAAADPEVVTEAETEAVNDTNAEAAVVTEVDAADMSANAFILDTGAGDEAAEQAAANADLTVDGATLADDGSMILDTNVAETQEEAPEEAVAEMTDVDADVDAAIDETLAAQAEAMAGAEAEAEAEVSVDAESEVDVEDSADAMAEVDAEAEAEAEAGVDADPEVVIDEGAEDDMSDADMAADAAVVDADEIAADVEEAVNGDDDAVVTEEDVPASDADEETGASAEETATEEATSEETASEEAASEDTASEDTASEDTAAEETASEETASEDADADMIDMDEEAAADFAIEMDTDAMADIEFDDVYRLSSTSRVVIDDFDGGLDAIEFTDTSFPEGLAVDLVGNDLLIADQASGDVLVTVENQITSENRIEYLILPNGKTFDIGAASDFAALEQGLINDVYTLSDGISSIEIVDAGGADTLRLETELDEALLNEIEDSLEFVVAGSDLLINGVDGQTFVTVRDQFEGEGFGAGAIETLFIGDDTFSTSIPLTDFLDGVTDGDVVTLADTDLLDDADFAGLENIVSDTETLQLAIEDFLAALDFGNDADVSVEQSFGEDNDVLFSIASADESSVVSEGGTLNVSFAFTGPAAIEPPVEPVIDAPVADTVIL